ncbi:MAG: bifunctional alpha,alpha-trehalose-phosphate synthase (UDP-forming)/trehalose-phosphatase [Saprospiraceae bacterium]|nr:bifunctional alpha,alpha-trehalose-phosphate synthase (UDP-forming)/trehalose-phosphatase [Saprospiraceae bacterium]
MKLKNKKLIIVSNRLPIRLRETDIGTFIEENKGGLTSAINKLLEDKTLITQLGINEIHWIGTAKCTSPVWHDNKEEIDKLPYKVKPIFIPSKLKTSFIDGFSLTTLLPLLLYFPSYAEYNQEWFDAYRAANELFYKKISTVAQEGDIVWVQDYHLFLLPEMLRQDYKNIAVGLFLHTPFPSFEMIRLLPQKWRDQILRGMLGADLVGFQTGDYVQHFERTVQQLLEKEYNDVIFKKTKIDKFAMGIDFERYNTAFNLPEVKAFRDNFHEKLSTTKLIVSIDKFDYAKGVSNRLEGYAFFLEKYPEWQRHVTFILSITPSRHDLTKYATLKKKVEETVKHINNRFGTPDWLPIIYRYDTWAFERIVGLYSVADIALITPLRDGMNLLAKEFVATRFDKQGVLILSDMAGAAEELKDAVLTHPTDVEDIANKIRYALLMTPQEQETRMTRMQELIAKHNVQVWAEDFLTQLDKVKTMKSHTKPLLLDDKKKLLEDFKKARKRLIILDYDGTLVDFRLNPNSAKPSIELLSLLKRLSKHRNNHIVINSGRNAENLEEWFGHLPITLIAEHGLMVRPQYGHDWEMPKNLKTKWKDKIRPTIQEAVNRSSESTLEEKTFSLVWHYERMNIDTARLRINQLIKDLSSTLQYHKLEILHSKKIVEIRPKGMDKGSAINKLLTENTYNFILAMGDDLTDENMFSALSEEKAYTIKIGQGATCAEYRLAGPLWTIALLENLAGFNEKEKDSVFFSLISTL